MGGTSTDVCLLARRRGRARGRADGRRAPGPAPDGRRAHGRRGRRVDRRGATPAARSASGPRAPGADPGPACYGRGGDAADRHRREPPARAAAGRARRAASSSTGRRPERALDGIDPAAVVDGRERRDAAGAARRLGRARPRPARVRARRLRRRGPLHACALAEELGIAAVLVPDAAGVLSAARSRRERRAARPRRARTSCPLAEAGELPGEGEADLRYRGQSFELTVPLGDDARRALPPRARGALRLRRPRSGESSSSPCARRTCARPRRSSSRPARPARRRRARPLLELDGATCWVPPGWVGARDGPTLTADARRDAIVNVELQVIGSALRAIAEEMGAVLIRSAFSREHQGAPRLLDRALRRARPDDRAGRAHPRPPRRDARRRRRRHARTAPARRGRASSTTRTPAARTCPTSRSSRAPRSASPSRAPTTPTSAGSSRASMPAVLAHARGGGRRHPADAARRRRSLEALVARMRQPGGAPRRPARPARRAPPRRAPRRRALRAPRAATASPRRWTSSTPTPSGSCARRSRASRRPLRGARTSLEAVDGDLAIHAARRRSTATRSRSTSPAPSPQHDGNLNCPLAVTRSACYFVVRCLTDPDIPASGGAFAPVTVRAPEGCLVNARPPAAVAAGNVETSCRIVDVVFARVRPARSTSRRRARGR